MPITLAPAWIEEQRGYLADFAAEQGRSLSPRVPARSLVMNVERFSAAIDRIRQLLLDWDSSDEVELQFLRNCWDVLICDGLREVNNLRSQTQNVLFGRFSFPPLFAPNREYDRLDTVVYRSLIDLARTILVARPDLELSVPTDIETLMWAVRTPPFAYLRAMGNLFWSAIRHPLSETTIDLSTGRVLYRT